MNCQIIMISLTRLIPLNFLYKVNIRDPHFIIPILETLNKSYDFVRVLYTNVFFTGVKIYTLVLF